MKPAVSQKLLYAIITVGSAIGFVASFLQILEKFTLLKNADAVLSCNLNAVFNCSNILNAPQSSVFGFPNSLPSVTFFVLMLSAGLIGWTGGLITKKLRFAYQALSVFFIGFGFWFLWQSIFNVGNLCIFCFFNYGGLLMISGAWFRLNYKDLTLNTRNRQLLDRAVASGADIFLWVLIALMIAFEAILKFA